LRRLGREQDQARSRVRAHQGIEAGVPADLNMVDIVHRRAAYPAIVPLETEGFDQVHWDAETGAEPKHGADILGNLRLVQGDPHDSRALMFESAHCERLGSP
jgi:hypothetical protein